MAKKSKQMNEKELKPKVELKTSFSRDEIQEQFKQIAKQKSDLAKEQKKVLGDLRVLNDKGWLILKKEHLELFNEKEEIVKKLNEFDSNINTLNIQMNFLSKMLNTKKEGVKNISPK